MQYSWLDTEFLMREADTGLEIFALQLDTGLLRRRRRRGRVRRALVGQRQESRKLPGRGPAVSLPEFRLLNREHARARDDHLERKRPPRTQLPVLLRIVPDSDVPLAHAHPLNGDTALVPPHSRIAHMTGEYIRRQCL